jgi:hypothetical protein
MPNFGQFTTNNPIIDTGYERMKVCCIRKITSIRTMRFSIAIASAVMCLTQAQTAVSAAKWKTKVEFITPENGE